MSSGEIKTGVLRGMSAKVTELLTISRFLHAYVKLFYN